MHKAIVYVVSPRNTFVVHHREVRGRNEITARGVCMKNYLNAQARELNYMSHIQQ